MTAIYHGEEVDRNEAWTLTGVPGESQNVPFMAGLGIFIASKPFPKEEIARHKAELQRYAADLFEEGRTERKLREANYDPYKSASSNKIGMKMSARFREFGATFLLDKAISHHQDAVDTSLDTKPSYVDYVFNLSIVLSDRFSILENPDDVERAILYEAVVMELISGEIDKFSYRNEIFFKDDSDEGWNVWKDVHKGFSKREWSEEKSFNESGLQRSFTTLVEHTIRTAYMLHQKYLVENYFTDLSSAAELLEFALQTAQNKGSDTSMRSEVTILTRLARVYNDQFYRVGQKEISTKSLHLIKRAVDIRGKMGLSKSFEQLLVLSEIHYQMFRWNGNKNALNKAIHYGLRAARLKSGPRGRWREAELSSHLGFLFGARSHTTKSQADLTRGIRYLQQAIELTMNESGSRIRHLLRLGDLYVRRFEMANHLEDLAKSTEAFRSAFACSTGSNYLRYLAKFSTVHNLARLGSWSQVLELLEQMKSDLSIVFPYSLSREDLQFRLKRVTGLASLSASVFLKAGRLPSVTLEVLELFRGIILSRMMMDRYEDPNLEEQHSNIWYEYSHARNKLFMLRSKFIFEAPAPVEAPRLIDKKLIADRSSSKMPKLIEAMDRAVHKLRSLPNFERFLLPLQKDAMCALAREGPIVSLNVSHASSEAFLISETSIKVIQLPGLRRADMKRCIKLFASKSNAARRDASLCAEEDDNNNDNDSRDGDSNLQAELDSLWTHVVQPILQTLGILSQHPKPHPLPRVWWVVGGIMSLLPLHAAGRHTLGSTENTLTHVVSSYASSLMALDFLRSKPPFTIQGDTAKVVVVSMPTSPRHVPLAVAREVEAITTHTAPWASTVCLERPTKRRVLYALSSCTIAHFACHGSIDAIDPARSALIVGREAEERLTVQDLDTVNCDHSKLAYLSACSTAEISLRNVADESINVANSFQMSGFQHVVGTLWGADDDAAANIASYFYQGLIIYKDNNNASVAQALHDAVLQYRAKDSVAMDVSKWAPFIHLGC